MSSSLVKTVQPVRIERLRAFDLHNDYDWLTLLDDRVTDPVLLESLPEHQTDLLFTRREI